VVREHQPASGSGDDVAEAEAVLDVDVVEPQAEAGEERVAARGIGVVAAPALRGRAAGQQQGPRRPRAQRGQVDGRQEIRPHLEEVGPGRELVHAGERRRRVPIAQRHADARQIKKPLQVS
jgi:hypothetical protein